MLDTNQLYIQEKQQTNNNQSSGISNPEFNQTFILHWYDIRKILTPSFSLSKFHFFEELQNKTNHFY